MFAKSSSRVTDLVMILRMKNHEPPAGWGDLLDLACSEGFVSARLQLGVAAFKGRRAE